MRKTTISILVNFLFGLASAEAIYTKYNGFVKLDEYMCHFVDSSFVHRICFNDIELRAVVLLNDTYYQYCGVNSSVFSS